MDATAAIAELRELSTQIETVVVIARDGSLVAASVQDEAANGIAAAARDLKYLQARIAEAYA